jgi:precorrin-6A synthase
MAGESDPWHETNATIRVIGRAGNAPGGRARQTRSVKKVLVIGIGAGDPDHVTVEASRALDRADVFLVLDKGDARADLAEVRRRICERHIDGTYRVVTVADPERDLGGPSYRRDVAAWHAQRVDIYERFVRDEVGDGGCGALMVWGDPSLYDSTLRILDQVAARGTVEFAVEVIPGISSVQVLAARFAIALHGVGAPVHITTGRRLAAGWPPGAGDDVVVMLDGSCAFADLDPDGVTIYWGAYLGTDDEILVSGPLGEVADDIRRVRAEARARKGWMFDTYLLRRHPGRTPTPAALGDGAAGP